MKKVPAFLVSAVVSAATAIAVNTTKYEANLTTFVLYWYFLYKLFYHEKHEE